MKTKAAKERDRKSRAERGVRAAESLAKDARAARSKWNKPNRRKTRELLEEASNDEFREDDGFATHVLVNGKYEPLPGAVKWKN